MAHIFETSFDGNPNVGLYMFANDKFCLVGASVSDSVVNEIENVLKVPVHRVNICGTSMIGVFVAGNNKCILVPEIAFDSELKKLDALGIKYEVIYSKLTALGNNILCNDKGALVNPDYSADVKKKIRQALDVDLKPGTVAGINTVGSASSVNSRACVTHIDATDDEILKIKDLLGVEVYTGTVNLGNPFVGSGLCCNTNGFVIGNQTTGPEVTMIDEYLGFLDY